MSYSSASFRKLNNVGISQPSQTTTTTSANQPQLQLQQQPLQQLQQLHLHMKPNPHIPHHQLPGTVGTRTSIPQPALMALNSILTLGPFKHRKDLTRESVLSTYQIMGYIAAGTYGKVYKAKLKSNKLNKTDDDSGIDGINNKDILSESMNDLHHDNSSSIMINTTTNITINNSLPQFFAIKKFKSDNHHHHINNNNNGGNHLSKGNNSIHQDEVLHYTGISQSAIREMSLCRELNNKNITKLVDIILENKSIYMVFEFCEHDLLQIIHYQLHPDFKPIPCPTIKSLIWQILNGVTFLHKNWILHRDLKPANIMVSSQGVVKIGDLGLARKFKSPLQSLYTGDKVVVTIWYRAPELLLGTRHYTPAVDLWAVGCILAELLSLRPIFKGEEAKIDLNNKKSVPFQKNQLQKIIEILGTPTTDIWNDLNKYPEYLSFTQHFNQNYPNNLSNWFKLINGGNNQNSEKCLELLSGLLKYDPELRLTADQALLHPYFLELPKVNENAFEGLNYKYPNRKIYTDDNDIMTTAANNNNNNNVNNNNNNNNNNSGHQLLQQQNVQIQQVHQMQQQIHLQQLQLHGANSTYKRSGIDDLPGGIRKKRG